MPAVVVVTAVNNSEEGYDGPPDIEFTATIDGATLFKAMLESGAAAAEWDALAEACETGAVYKIGLEPDNGAMQIDVAYGVVQFEIGQFGNGNGGYVTVHVPARQCAPAFREAAAITRRWLAADPRGVVRV